LIGNIPRKTAQVKNNDVSNFPGVRTAVGHHALELGPVDRIASGMSIEETFDDRPTLALTVLATSAFLVLQVECLDGLLVRTHPDVQDAGFDALPLDQIA
jgi:hypothetical protein